MPKLKLTYFDFHGGRGEVARIAFFIGDVPFEDDRVKGADWAALKPNTPFGGIPVLTVDGQEVAWSDEPDTTPEQRLKVDMMSILPNEPLL